MPMAETKRGTNTSGSQVGVSSGFGTTTLAEPHWVPQEIAATLAQWAQSLP